ncbi:CBS domain-containing protein [Desulfatibacillum alkenivorans]|jgi:nanoRNase/pAp phosphatase (c-di-AMP/oligoRNAs hydrolase)|uniref:CBS domain-containing protein n=1 Tax=Desulfatibacillum alkenivorans TaxID=259354 RepID=UPI00313C7AC6
MLDIATTHNSSDFDALASLVAAGILYPGADLVLPTRVNPNIQAFLSIHKDLFEIKSFKDVDVNAVTRLIVVDVNQWKRLERLSTLSSREDLEVHIWDHHMVPSDMKASKVVQEPLGACTTLLIEEIKRQNLEISPMQATLFLAGIYEDTGNLAFPSTTARDAMAVAYLLSHQADLNVLENFLRPAYGVKQKDVLFEMLQKAERIKVGGHRVSICEMEITGHTHGLSLVVHMYRDILNVDAAFGIFNDAEKGRCIVIARSGVDSMDVGQIMRIMGGGGHPAAASAMLRDVNPIGVKEWILELIRENQRSTILIGDLMSFPVETIDAKTSMKDTAEILKKRAISGMPVTEEGKLVGVISRRDVNKIKKQSQWRAPVKAFMSTDMITAPPHMSVPKAARIMVKHDVGRLPVVDDGELIGIFTRSDAMLYYYDLLPE